MTFIKDIIEKIESYEQIHTQLTHDNDCCGCLNIVEHPIECKLLIYCNECGLITQEVEVAHP